MCNGPAVVLQPWNQLPWTHRFFYLNNHLYCWTLHETWKDASLATQNCSHPDEDVDYMGVSSPTGTHAQMHAECAQYTHYHYLARRLCGSGRGYVANSRKHIKRWLLARRACRWSSTHTSAGGDLYIKPGKTSGKVVDSVTTVNQLTQQHLMTLGTSSTVIDKCICMERFVLVSFPAQMIRKWGEPQGQSEAWYIGILSWNCILTWRRHLGTCCGNWVWLLPYQCYDVQEVLYSCHKPQHLSHALPQDHNV